MKKAERLKIYEEMLLVYKANRWKLFRDEIVKYGFCNYMNRVYGISPYTLLELYSTRPVEGSRYTNYWFKPGKLTPRIKCLKKAISLCK